jgi:hypothetical protein
MLGLIDLRPEYGDMADGGDLVQHGLIYMYVWADKLHT